MMEVIAPAECAKLGNVAPRRVWVTVASIASFRTAHAKRADQDTRCLIINASSTQERRLDLAPLTTNAEAAHVRAVVAAPQTV